MLRRVLNTLGRDGAGTRCSVLNVVHGNASLQLSHALTLTLSRRER
jgi:hypothetical protein